MGLIYKITNLATGQVCAVLTWHTFELQYAKHCSTTMWSNKALRADMKRYGLSKFEAKIVEDNAVDAQETIRCYLDLISSDGGRWYAEGRWYLTKSEQRTLKCLYSAMRVGIKPSDAERAIAFLRYILPSFYYDVDRHCFIAVREGLIQPKQQLYATYPNAFTGSKQKAGTVVVVTKGAIVAEVSDASKR